MMLAAAVAISDDVFLPSDYHAPLISGQTSPAVPYGANEANTSEYMLGTVHVSVVLMESNGALEFSRENWSAARIGLVKSEIQEGLSWWTNTLVAASPQSQLSFQIDFTYADSPVATGYEPITHPYYDENLWIDSFLTTVGYNSAADHLTDMRKWDADQRIAHDTNWAFTIFVVDSYNDSDGIFADGRYFGYAYLGGPFTVLTYDNDGWGISRMGQVLAHETAHLFMALDEYSGSGSTYTDYSGYYNTQNVNAFDDNPNIFRRVDSLMGEADEQTRAYAANTSSPSSLEMIGWRNTNTNGVFDVLDVPLSLSGSGTFNTAAGQYQFNGASAVQAMVNQNPWYQNPLYSYLGARNNITINTVDRIQYRLDGGLWTNGSNYGTPAAIVSQNVAVATAGFHTVEFRTLAQNGVASNIWSDTFTAAASEDLSLASLSGVPAGVQPGQTFTASRTYAIAGSAATSDFSLQYRLSQDTLWGNADDIVLTPDELISNPAAKVVGAYAGSSIVTVPASTPLGTYYLLGKVDSGDAIAETSEANNIAVGSQILVTLASSPNLATFLPAGWSDRLVVSNRLSTHADDAPLNSLDTLYVDFGIINNGTAATIVNVGYTLSVDGVVVNSGTNAALARDASITVSDFNLGALAAGSHTISLTIDPMNAIAEVDETDNVFTKSITVLSLNPDIAATSVTVATPIPMAGENLTITRAYQVSTVRVVPHFSVEYRLSTDAIWGNANDIVLAPAETITTPINKDIGDHSADYVVALAPGLAGGAYYLLARFDSGNVVGETNETNNITVSGKIAILPAYLPNLTPSQPTGWSDKLVLSRAPGGLTGDSPLYSCDEIYIDWAVSNIGSAPAVGTVTYALYVDGVLKNSWTSPGLDSLATYTQNDYAIGSLPAGVHNVTLTIDAGNTIREISEADNTFARQFSVGVPRPGNLSGYIWEDIDGDNIEDAGEPNLANRTVFLDENANGWLDSSTVSVASGDLLTAIPDGNTITVNLPVNTLIGRITDIDVSLNIAHTCDSDLVVFLINPAGQRVRLTAQHGGTGDNFSNTIFDDEAATPIALGTAPFIGRFRPSETLAVYDGTRPNGTWQLEIRDTASGDVGTVNRWSLTFSTKEVSTLTDAAGNYTFANVPAGAYTVCQMPVLGWRVSMPVTGTYVGRLSSSGNVTDLDFANQQMADATAPAVASFKVNDGNAQRSMVKKLVVTFSEPIALGLSAIRLLNGSGVDMPNVAVSAANPLGELMTWELTLSGSGLTNGSLPDGSYRLVINAAGVTDLAGNHLTGDYSQRFHRLFGDSDGDRDVDTKDVTAFRQAMGSGAYVSWFDYNGNGRIDNADYLQIRSRLTKPLLL